MQEGKGGVYCSEGQIESVHCCIVTMSLSLSLLEESLLLLLLESTENYVFSGDAASLQ